MTPSDESPHPDPAGRGLTVESLGGTNRRAVTELATRAWDRSRSAESLAWRYEDCPALQAAVALNKGECVACVFGLQRTYWSPAGDVECLEPFDWYTADQWRPRGAGLRVMRHLMSGPRPLIALGGSQAGLQLLGRLGWRHLWTAKRLFLPLSGRFLEQRGHGNLVVRGFDLVGKALYAPRRGRERSLRVEPAGFPGPALGSILERQGRFGLVPRPNPETLRWLRQAPSEMGLYLGFNLLARGVMVGWAWSRVLTANGVRIGDLQDLLLADEALDLYPEAVRHITAVLAGFDVDVIIATTSCPDTLAALEHARFRLDSVLPVYGWWPGREPPATALITSSHAEHAFFPTPTSKESAWATAE